MCPKCGSLDSDKEFVGSFCVDCYTKHADVFELPHKPTLRMCRVCNRAVVGKDWEVFDENNLGEWIASKLKLKVPLAGIEVWQEDAKNGFTVHCKLSFNSQGGKIVREAHFLVRTNMETCDNCHKRSGGYHEAIIQVRGENKERIKRIAEKIVKIAEEESFVSGLEERKEGIDIQVGAKAAAKAALRKIGKTFTVTHKLVGMRQGKQLFRATFCMRV